MDAIGSDRRHAGTGETAGAGVTDPITETDLLAIAGPGSVVSGEDLRSRDPGYFMSSIDARLLVRPSTTEQVSQILALCNERRQPVVVHGGVSGWVRATQTRPEEIILSMERMNAIERIDVENRSAVVQAGVILQTFQEAVEEQGLCFPLDLGGRGSCQLGGNASTNAGGMRVLRYGMMREQVLGVEAVLADGRIVSSMNSMLKNNTGFDLKQLFIGSEGTLGVITRLVLRLRESPVSCNTAMVAVKDMATVARLLRRVDAGLGGQLSAFELIDSDFFGVNTGDERLRSPFAEPSPFYVIVESLGADQERDAEIFESVLSDALETGLVSDAVIAGSERERGELWAIRETLEHVVSDFTPFYAFDVSLTVGEMDGYMREVRAQLAQAFPDGRIAFLGHVGDGNLHIAIGAGGPDDRHAVESCVYKPLAAIGGSLSAEHGIGLEKKPWLRISRNDVEIGLMLQLKDLFDPRGILNPGKILDREAN